MSIFSSQTPSSLVLQSLDHNTFFTPLAHLPRQPCMRLKHLTLYFFMSSASPLLLPQISDLPSGELVPGDVVELHVGDKVPADVRVVTLRTATVRAEQSSLTGESTKRGNDEEMELRSIHPSIRPSRMVFPLPQSSMHGFPIAWCN